MFQNMNYDQLWKVICSEMDSVNKLSVDEYSAWLRAGNTPGSIPADQGSFRTTEKGQAAIEALGQLWRRDHPDMRALVTEKEISDITLRLFGAILDKKYSDRFGQGEGDLVVIRALLGEQVTELSRDLVHYFPCHVFRTTKTIPFNLGPVYFVPTVEWPDHVEKVATKSLNWTGVFRQVWRGEREKPQRPSTGEELQKHPEVSLAVGMLDNVGPCPYIAEVRVPKKLGMRSRSTSEVAVRVAIDSLAILLPQKIARLLRGPMDDLAPRIKRPLTQPDGRDILLSMSLDLPGWELPDKEVSNFLNGYAAYFEQVGHSLTHFIGGDLKVSHPELRNRWVEAMAWYGQAKRNATDFMALVECGIALDVLTKGGKAAGIKKLCASALGIPGTQAMWNGIELDKWVTKIYNEGRSQFGHGGFLGLQSDLPITVIDSLDLLTVVLEIFVSRLAEYQGDDDAKAYSDWMEANPPKKPATP